MRLKRAQRRGHMTMEMETWTAEEDASMYMNLTLAIPASKRSLYIRVHSTSVDGWDWDRRSPTSGPFIGGCYNGLIGWAFGAERGDFDAKSTAIQLSQTSTT